MPLSLINPINSLERALTQQGLDTIDCGEADLRVYGGGEWIPGEAFDKLLEAKRLGAYLGVIGMTIPEDILASDIASSLELDILPSQASASAFEEAFARRRFVMIPSA